MMIYDFSNDVWIEYGTEDNFGHKVSQLPSEFEITNFKNNKPNISITFCWDRNWLTLKIRMKLTKLDVINRSFIALV